jgi:hypothetical protein
MTIRLRQSTASQEVPLGHFVDSADGNTEETGLTIAATDIKLWKAGATSLANKNSGGATHMANGVYVATLDATDTATLGPLVIFVHVAGALPVRVECEVLAANVYDALVAASDKLDVNAAELGGTAQTGRDIGASVLLSPGTGTGQVSLAAGKVDVNDKTGFTLAAAGSAALTEGYAADGAAPTLAQLLHMIWSMLAEKSVAGTTLTTKRLDGSTTAMTFTLDHASAPTSITRSS